MEGVSERFIVRYKPDPPLDGWQIVDTVTQTVTHADDHTPEAKTHQDDICQRMNTMSVAEQDRIWGRGS